MLRVLIALAFAAAPLAARAQHDHAGTDATRAEHALHADGGCCACCAGEAGCCGEGGCSGGMCARDGASGHEGHGATQGAGGGMACCAGMGEGRSEGGGMGCCAGQEGGGAMSCCAGMHGAEGHGEGAHGDMHRMHHPPAYGAAETPAHEAVRAAVVALFDAMRAGSADGIRAAFHPDAVLMSVGAGRDGALRVRTEEAEAFAEAVGAPHEEVYDERIGPVEVRVDGPLATAWMTYRFHVGERLSHCGVNAFQLADTGEGWKVVAVTDTRRAECEGMGETAD